MSAHRGTEARCLNATELRQDASLDASLPLTLNLGAYTRPQSGLEPLRLEEVPALILALLGRTEPELAPYEERVLRACLCLAGEELTPAGGFDADFYEALLAFKHRHRLQPVDARLDLPTLTQIVQRASIAVGAPSGSPWTRLRGVWFDVMRAPALIAEAPGIVNLVRELKGGRTRMPTLTPLHQGQAGEPAAPPVSPRR
ncbi:MAG: hypothetical protein VKP62_14555 [Candidatus Sericytochromatia bacterium]|nr:hypothetical protein [Candidatus Sericytochromatia bacterium]